jgi:hypothetical protein
LNAYQLTLMAPLASFEVISQETLNQCLLQWSHKMGPLLRPMHRPCCYGLMHNGEIIGVIACSSLIPEQIAGLTRENTIEVSRLCAARPGLCRVVLRLWRELVFPFMGYEYAISYQDEELHTGNTYRFDGWKPLTRTRSGTDQRSGRKGRKKTVWVWKRKEAVQ